MTQRINLTTLFILLYVFTAHGCARHPYTPDNQVNMQLPTQESKDEQFFWWHARFKIHWPENSPPDFSIDALLADAVIEPILLRHQHNISLWRFHRRSHRDDAGHRFSFIFYAGRTTAKKIFDEIKNDSLIITLLAHKIIDAVTTDDLNNNELSQVNNASDPHWSATLQNAWPAFIMGVSATWLQLINQLIDEKPANTAIDALMAQYNAAHQKISEIWHGEGQHAFLHHLNALFGYEPIRIEQSLRY